MKIEMIKLAGGILCPASDLEMEKLVKLKTEGQYTIEIKQARNPDFHRKVFAFFNFCFAHWRCDREFLNEAKQFDIFRKNLTALAGYYDQFYNIKGEVRIEAKSLSYGSMSQDEFEDCYSALISAAIKHIFQTADESTYNQLLSFF